MTGDELGIVAAGGWCAPSEIIFDRRVPMGEEPEFPRVTVQRGALHFPRPGTPEWDRLQTERAASDAMMALIHRAVGDMIRAQDAVIEYAYLVALTSGYDVHVHRRPYLPLHAEPYAARFIGISLEPRPSDRRVPMVYEHTRDATYDDWDDD
jgi:hypothetical protein